MKIRRAGSSMSLAALAGVALVLAAAPAVWAQPAPGSERQGPGGPGGPGRMRGPGGPGGGMGGGMMGRFGGMNDMPQVSQRHLEKYLAIVGATPEQVEAAKELHKGYRDQIKSSEDAMRAKMGEVREKFRENRDPAVFESMRDEMNKAREARVKMDAALLGDVKSLMGQEQMERWPRVERAVRRDQSLGRGQVSGERVDVVALVDEQKLDAAAMATLQPILERYEEDVDRMLGDRNKLYEEARTKLGEAFQNRDPSLAEEAVSKARDAGVRLRDVNQKYARQAAEAMPEANRPAFQRAVERATYPQVYRETIVDRQFAAAAQLPDVNDDQRAQLKAAQEVYERSRSGVNAKLVEAIKENEANFSVEQMANRFRQRGEEQGPMAGLYRERQELDRKAGEDLKKILLPDQMERLPSPEVGEEGEGRPGRRGGRRGGEPQT